MQIREQTAETLRLSGKLNVGCGKSEEPKFLETSSILFTLRHQNKGGGGALYMLVNQLSYDKCLLRKDSTQGIITSIAGI